MKKFVSSLVLVFAISLAIGQTSLIQDVPYFNQMCNSNNPTGTCQISSMAMVLKAYGATSITPDYIYNNYDYSDAKDVPGWKNMFESLAQTYGLSVRSDSYSAGSVSQLRSALAAGKPVTVHGYFTGGGHVIVIVGYDGSNYICQDPYGEWNEVYGGSYSSVYCGSTAGEYVYYSASAVESVIDIGGIWMHVPTESLSTTPSDPYCTSKGNNTVGEWISSIAIGAFTKNSGNNNGYGDYTSSVIYTSQNESYGVTLTPEFSSQSYTEYWKIWIDLNQDGDLSDAGEEVFSGSGTSAVSGTITIPANAAIGQTRMRIAMKGDAAPTPCETFSYGEVEDYTIDIAEGATNEEVTISVPAMAYVGEPAAFSGTASDGVQNVIVKVDTYEITNETVTDGTYSFSYTFTSAASGREVVAEAYNASGTLVATDTKTIDVENPPEEVTISVPAMAYVGEPAAFSGTASDGVQNVIVKVDTYEITNETVTDGTYSFSYTFTSAASGREVVAEAYNASGTLVATDTKTIDVENPPIPEYCTSKGNDVYGEWVKTVTIGAFTKATGANSGYADFTSDMVYVATNESYSISLEPGFRSTTYNESWRVWIDFNQDGDFEDAGEQVFAPGLSKNTVSGTITIPSDAILGNTRMRVSMKGDATQTPCETFSYGEVEDYTVNITEGSAVTYNVTVNNPAEAAVGESVTFSGTATDGVQSVRVKVDGWEIANEPVTNGAYSFDYTFNGLGNDRQVTAQAIINDEVVATAQSTIDVVEAASEGNQLGIWLWYIQNTNFATHEDLAAELASLGVKRIYVKVGDGNFNPSTWPENTDASVPQAYQNAGLECWAWSYNYPDNDAAQAQCLYEAAKVGYDGYVLDVEVEFNGKTTELHNIFQAFQAERTNAINDGYISSDFQIAATTWGNPVTHGMRVDIIDQYVDFHMPQTYTEIWGTLSDQAGSIADTEAEYNNNYGCTKPINHICAAEKGIITSSQIDEFISIAGPETSIWVVPGPSLHSTIWPTIQAVNWNAFENQSKSAMVAGVDNELPELSAEVSVYPNPASTYTRVALSLSQPSDVDIQIYDIQGKQVYQKYISSASGTLQENIDLQEFKTGMYLVRVTGNGLLETKKLMITK